MRKFSVARPLGLALALGALTASAWSVAALAQDSGQAIPRAKAQNIVNTATAAGQFKTLVSLVQQAGLAGTLSTGGPYTVFAPTDAAFAKLPRNQVESLLKDKEKLKGILLFHVLPGSLSAAAVGKMHDGDKVKTVSGKEFTVSRKDDVLTVNGAVVSKTDLPASNGVIRAIDTVIRPN